MVKPTSKIETTQFPLLATKLYLPQPRPDWVKRAHLIDRLNKGINHQLTLISAPAGFGKTTLLSEWISYCEIPVAWISLDKGDNDPVHFMHYLIAALQGFDVNIGKTALSMLQSPQQLQIELIMTNLIKDINDISNHCVLVLDDYHSVDTKEIHEIVEFLIDYLPPQTRLVISTRVDPPFSLARLRVRNQLTELRVTDLSFTVDDTSIFFNEMMNLGLSSTDISLLESRTEGWIAGLQLAALSMQGCEDIPMFIKTFAGDDRHIVDYLTEEVLNLQPESIKKFLLQTSILNRLSGPLCDFVTDSEGCQQMLDDLERTNLFIAPLDSKRHWYRYHHLFSDLLRQRIHDLHDNTLFELHTRASKWFEQNEFEEEAVNHALCSKNFEHASHLIKKYAENIFKSGRKDLLLRWLKILPSEIINKDSKLCFFNSWMLFESGSYNAAEEKLKLLEELIDPSGKSTEIAQATENDNLRGRLAVIRARIATAHGRIADVIKFSKEALKYLPENDLIWRTSTFLSLGIAYTITGDMPTAIDVFKQAKKLGKIAHNDYFFLHASYWLVTRFKYTGQLQKAIESCKKLLIFVEERQIPDYVVGAGLYVNYGDILYEINDLEGALQYVSKGIEIVDKNHEVAAKGWSYFCLLRILYAKHDISGVDDLISKLEKLEQDHDLPSWVSHHLTTPWIVRFWLSNGRINKAIDWMESKKFNVDKPLVPFYEPENIVIARVLIAQNKLSDAEVLIENLLKSEETGGRVLSEIETLLIKAFVLDKQGDKKGALDTMGKALFLAEPGGYIRIFLDEGHHIAELLEKLLDVNIDAPGKYIKKLLSAFKLHNLIETDGDLLERLSERELEVLRFVAAGLSNKKVTEELFISLSTVKTHLRNIYSKLNVHSRTEALVKAKELNLL